MILDIFPDQGLSYTIYLPVLIGIFFLWLCNEAFGWPRDGWVVPGYVGMVLFTNPESAALMMIEALYVYYAVVLFSEMGARLGFWNRFFGRERFFLFVIVSILVRYLFELWLLHPSTSWLSTWLSEGTSSLDAFHSIGLVLVPLIANSFWKSGPAKGMLRTLFLLGITYSVIRLALQDHTNFTIEYFRLIYEDISMRFESGAKVYVILIVAGYVAAWTNLRWGWDYNGILMPSLLAVAMFFPIKILASLIEAIIIAFAFGLITKVRPFNTIAFGGGRQILVLYALEVGIKWIASIFYQPLWPGMKVTDLFGFGYVLPALLAVKILQKRQFGIVIGPTMVCIVLSFALGTLTSISVTPFFENVDFNMPDPNERTLAEGSLVNALSMSKATRPSQAEIATFIKEPLAYQTIARRLTGWVLGESPLPTSCHDRSVSRLKQRYAYQCERYFIDNDHPLNQHWSSSFKKQSWLHIHLREKKVEKARSGSPELLVAVGGEGPRLLAEPYGDDASRFAALKACLRVNCAMIVFTPRGPENEWSFRKQVLTSKTPIVAYKNSSKSPILEVHLNERIQSDFQLTLFGDLSSGQNKQLVEKLGTHFSGSPSSKFQILWDFMPERYRFDGRLDVKLSAREMREVTTRKSNRPHLSNIKEFDAYENRNTASLVIEPMISCIDTWASERCRINFDRAQHIGRRMGLRSAQLLRQEPSGQDMVWAVHMTRRVRDQRDDESVHFLFNYHAKAKGRILIAHHWQSGDVLSSAMKRFEEDEVEAILWTEGDGATNRASRLTLAFTSAYRKLYGAHADYIFIAPTWGYCDSKNIYVNNMRGGNLLEESATYLAEILGTSPENMLSRTWVKEPCRDKDWRYHQSYRLLRIANYPRVWDLSISHQILTNIPVPKTPFLQSLLRLSVHAQDQTQKSGLKVEEDPSHNSNDHAFLNFSAGPSPAIHRGKTQ